MTPLSPPAPRRPQSPGADGPPLDEPESTVLPDDFGGAGRRRRLRIPRWLAAAAAALFVAALFIRLTIADRVPIASTVYYGTPWSILALLAGLNALTAHQHGRRQSRAGWMAAGACCAVIWAYSSWYFSGHGDSAGGARVVVWNMAHGNRGLPGLAKSLAELDPDIAILVEADPSRIDVQAVFERELPHHHVSMLGGGLVLVSRWPSGESIPYHVGSPQSESRIREIDVETPWGTWTVFAVDLGSNPVYSRKKPLQELARLIDRRGDRPVIVGGDFNTPLDSEHYVAFRDLGLRELFLSAGAGYLPTWPVPVPVLSLDQIWVNERLEPVRCERKWDWRSDHAAAVGTVKPR